MEHKKNKLLYQSQKKWKKRKWRKHRITKINDRHKQNK